MEWMSEAEQLEAEQNEYAERLQEAINAAWYWRELLRLADEDLDALEDGLEIAYRSLGAW